MNRYGWLLLVAFLAAAGLCHYEQTVIVDLHHQLSDAESLTADFGSGMDENAMEVQRLRTALNRCYGRVEL